MARPAAPSLPTEKQILDAYKAVSSLHPDAKILRVGPDGVTFDYGDKAGASGWEDRPFSAEVKRG